MAVAPDFHTDFLTVGTERLALSPTSPSGGKGSFCVRIYFITSRENCQDEMLTDAKLGFIGVLKL